MQKGISVIICCYNSAARLPETLKHLALQKTSASLMWEIIVVDNASTDNTANVANEFWKSLNRTNVPFKVIFENQPGLSFARECGVNKAQHEYIIFCDDDNWLNDDYLQTAYNFMLANKTIGAMSGQSTAVSDVDFPEWFKDPQQAYVYVVGKQASTSGIVNAQSYVWGAGMVTRKSIFNNAVNTNYPSILSDRKGGVLSSGGDVEYCLRIMLQGYNIYYNDDLVIKHFIPSWRLTEIYRDALYKGFEESRKIAREYLEAARIKNATRYEKMLLLITASKDFLKSFISKRKAQPFSYKLYFYLFNIGFKESKDLKLIKHFYNFKQKFVNS